MEHVHNFDYVLKKIENAPIITDPYPHIIISNFLSDNDYDNLLYSHHIDIYDKSCLHIPKVNTYNELKSKLQYAGWEPISYPGAVSGKTGSDLLNRPTGKGLVYKLVDKKADGENGIRTYLDMFLTRTDNTLNNTSVNTFINTLLNKFKYANNIGWNVYEYNKDLNGYEISPHPDVSGKLVTYQLNLAPDNLLAEYNLATRLLKLRPEYTDEIEKLAKTRARPWGLWEWFDETSSVPFIGNTFFAFPPTNDTYHAVKLEEYPEKIQQRTMIRGFILSNELLKKAPRSHWHPGNVINI